MPAQQPTEPRSALGVGKRRLQAVERLLPVARPRQCDGLEDRPRALAWGADIATAEGQSLGLPLQYGGPWAGLMACKAEAPVSFRRSTRGRH